MPAIGDLVHQSSTSTGTGNLTIAAVNGKRNFGDVFGTGGTTNVFHYYVSNRNAAEWEYGTGHMSDATTLVRDTVVLSSNANAAVSFSAGTLDVVNDYPASMQDVHAATSKTTPVDADELPLIDSAASNVLKKLTWANLKATAKTYFDTLYQPLVTILTTLAALANASGYLKNNGSGTLSWGTPVSGWTNLGNKTTTAGSTATLSGLTLTGYSVLLIVLNGVNGGVGTTLSQNSTAFTAAGAARNGMIIVDLGTGIAVYVGAGDTSLGWGSGLSTASTSISIVSSGTFTAGSYTVMAI